MGISIRDPEVGELARELANLRKTNMTEAIAHALRSELERERAQDGRWSSDSGSSRRNARNGSASADTS